MLGGLAIATGAVVRMEHEVEAPVDGDVVRFTTTARGDLRSA
jgi:hypothetical protein